MCDVKSWNSDLIFKTHSKIFLLGAPGWLSRKDMQVLISRSWTVSSCPVFSIEIALWVFPVIPFYHAAEWRNWKSVTISTGGRVTIKRHCACTWHWSSGFSLWKSGLRILFQSMNCFLYEFRFYVCRPNKARTTAPCSVHCEVGGRDTGERREVGRWAHSWDSSAWERRCARCGDIVLPLRIIPGKVKEWENRLALR